MCMMCAKWHHTCVLSLSTKILFIFDETDSQQHLSLQKESKLLNNILVSFYLESFVIKFVIFTDESEDESEEGEDTFMHSYSDALKEELKATTLKKSFVRADEQAPKKDEVLFLYFCKWG